MKILYIGTSTFREISDERGRFVWAPDVHYSVDVPANLAAELLTYPRPDFVPDAEDGLAKLDGIRVDLTGVPFGEAGVQALRSAQERSQAILAGLALAGIGNLAALGALDEAGIAKAAEVSGLDPKQIGAWVKQAKAQLKE